MADMSTARFSVASRNASALVPGYVMAKAHSTSDAKAPSYLLSPLTSPRLKAGCKEEPSEAGLRTHTSAQTSANLHIPHFLESCICSLGNPAEVFLEGIPSEVLPPSSLNNMRAFVV